MPTKKTQGPLAQQTAHKPSDFPVFAATVYSASATVMDFDTYLRYYEDLLQVLFWNPDVDTPMAIAIAEGQQKAAGVRHG
jgi:hypothetical protein